MNELFTVLILLLLFHIFFNCYCTYCLTCTVICALAFSWRLTGDHRCLEAKTTVSSVETLPPDPDDPVGFSSLNFLTLFILDFIFKQYWIFDKVVVTFCNLPHQMLGGARLTWKDQTTDNYIEIPTPQKLLFLNAPSLKCLSCGLVSGLGELMFGVYSQCYFSKWLYGIV